MNAATPQRGRTRSAVGHLDVTWTYDQTDETFDELYPILRWRETEQDEYQARVYPNRLVMMTFEGGDWPHSEAVSERVVSRSAEFRSFRAWMLGRFQARLTDEVLREHRGLTLAQAAAYDVVLDVRKKQIAVLEREAEARKREYQEAARRLREYQEGRQGYGIFGLYHQELTQHPVELLVELAESEQSPAPVGAASTEEVRRKIRAAALQRAIEAAPSLQEIDADQMLRAGADPEKVARFRRLRERNGEGAQSQE